MVSITNFLFMSILVGLCTSAAQARETTNEPTINGIEQPHYETISQGSPLAREEECLSSDAGGKCANLDSTIYSMDGFDSQQNAPNTVIDKANPAHLCIDVQPAEGSDTTLRQVLFIHRHGNRTPIQFAPGDPLANKSFWALHGYGQLTNIGKFNMHLLGNITRARYSKFLGDSVNKNLTISRSSGSLRCIESAQMFLSSFLALNQEHSPDAEQLVWSNNQLGHIWQPAAVQSVPADFDGMLAESAVCNLLLKEYEEAIEKSELVQNIYIKFAREKQVMDDVYGFKIDRFYKWFWASSQIEVERSYFGNEVDRRILDIYDRLTKAGEIALGAYQMTQRSKRLRSGLLINDMVNNMKLMQTSSKAKKFVHYSAHDMTLVVLLGMLDQWNNFPFRPDYSANIAIELHQDQRDGVWFVKVFYMPGVPGRLVELKLDWCRDPGQHNRCTLSRFESFLKRYMIASWQDWMTECQNDLRTVDPYKVGH